MPEPLANEPVADTAAAGPQADALPAVPPAVPVPPAAEGDADKPEGFASWAEFDAWVELVFSGPMTALPEEPEPKLPQQRPVPDCPIRRHLRQHARTTLFYPGCGLDLRHLYELYEYCNTFVYCDYGSAITQLEDPPYGLNGPESGLLVRSRRDVAVSHLNPEWLYHPPFLTVEEAAASPRWAPERPAPAGREYHLAFRDAPQRGEVTLFYLQSESYAAYVTLFKLQRIAPWGIVLQRSDRGFAGCNWIDNRQRTTPLGRAVHGNRAKPKLVLLGEYSGVPYDWDWTEPHMEFCLKSSRYHRVLARPEPIRRARAAAPAAVLGAA